jgi:hypothetical protein
VRESFAIRVEDRPTIRPATAFPDVETAPISKRDNNFTPDDAGVSAGADWATGVVESERARARSKPTLATTGFDMALARFSDE